MSRIQTVPLLLLALTCTACNKSAQPSGDASPRIGPGAVFISVVSDVDKNPQAIDMALKLAGFSLDEDRQVFMFFNVKGVTVPTKEFDETNAFGENEPIKKQLMALIERGATVHVCPICMKALGVEADDIVEGAEVTTRPKLFAKITGDTVVFTY